MPQRSQGAPQLFGAPTPSDPGGAFQASISGAQSNAQMQAQAGAQAAQMILQSLQIAMEVANRRDMQRNEIEASFKLQGMRDQAESERQAASERAAMARAQLQERGANRRTLFGERGQDRRFGADIKLRTEAEKTRSSQFERDLELRREGDQRERELHLPRLQSEWQTFQANQAAQFGRSFLPIAMSMAPFEPGAIPGTLQIKQGFPQSLAGAAGGMMGAGGAMGGPMGAGMQTGGQQIQQSVPDILSALQQLVKPQNELSTDAAAIGARGGGAGDGYEPPAGAQFTVGPDVLKELSKLAMSPDDKNALSELGRATILYDPSADKFSAPGTPAGLIDSLERLSRTGVGTRENIVGGILGPMLGAGDRMNLGSSVLNRTRGGQAAQPGAPQPETPKTAPKSKPQPSAKPRPAQGQPEPDGFLSAGATEPLNRATSGKAEDGSPPPTDAAEEARAAAAKAKFKAKYGVGAKPKAAEPKKR